MSEMVDRVARASFDFWKATQPGKENLKFEELNNLDEEMEFAIAHARAIIVAMLEPTGNMMVAGERGIKEGNPLESRAYHAWRAMISGALGITSDNPNKN